MEEMAIWQVEILWYAIDVRRRQSKKDIAMLSVGKQ